MIIILSKNYIQGISELILHKGILHNIFLCPCFEFGSPNRKQIGWENSLSYAILNAAATYKEYNVFATKFNFLSFLTSSEFNTASR